MIEVELAVLNRGTRRAPKRAARGDGEFRRHVDGIDRFAEPCRACGAAGDHRSDDAIVIRYAILARDDLESRRVVGIPMRKRRSDPSPDAVCVKPCQARECTRVRTVTAKAVVSRRIRRIDRDLQRHGKFRERRQSFGDEAFGEERSVRQDDDGETCRERGNEFGHVVPEERLATGNAERTES